MDKEKLVEFISEMLEKDCFLLIHTINLSDEREKAKEEAIEHGERISNILSVPVQQYDDEAYRRVVVDNLRMRFTFSHLKE